MLWSKFKRVAKEVTKGIHKNKIMVTFEIDGEEFPIRQVYLGKGNGIVITDLGKLEPITLYELFEYGDDKAYQLCKANRRYFDIHIFKYGYHKCSVDKIEFDAERNVLVIRPNFALKCESIDAQEYYYEHA